MALLPSGREVASITAEGSRAGARAEAARDFLLEFDHPQVALRAVVIEGHTRVRQKAQDLITAALQPLEVKTLLKSAIKGRVDSLCVIGLGVGLTTYREQIGPHKWTAYPYTSGHLMVDSKQNRTCVR